MLGDISGARGLDKDLDRSRLGILPSQLLSHSHGKGTDGLTRCSLSDTKLAKDWDQSTDCRGVGACSKLKQEMPVSSIWVARPTTDISCFTQSRGSRAGGKNAHLFSTFYF